MKLYGTLLSHFTRKLRILFAELQIDFEFVGTPSVSAPGADAYGNNPLMRVPMLVGHVDELLEVAPGQMSPQRGDNLRVGKRLGEAEHVSERHLVEPSAMPR